MTEKLLNDQVADQVRQVFADLQNPVKVVYFGQQEDCEYCVEAQQLLTEVTDLSEKLTLDIYDLNENAGEADKFSVDKAPGIVLLAQEGDQLVDYGVRFAGIPAGHEFSSLIHDLILVSGRDSQLNQETRDFLRSLEEPVHLQVFVTPTCPYCPQAVVLAHQMAIESPMVQAEMVEAMEFPELSNRFQVSGVPQTTINQGKGRLVGSAPEERLVEEIKRVLA
jgi:glutaredoxin-like protein